MKVMRAGGNLVAVAQWSQKTKKLAYVPLYIIIYCTDGIGLSNLHVVRLLCYTQVFCTVDNYRGL